MRKSPSAENDNAGLFAGAAARIDCNLANTHYGGVPALRGNCATQSNPTFRSPRIEFLCIGDRAGHVRTHPSAEHDNASLHASAAAQTNCATKTPEKQRP